MIVPNELFEKYNIIKVYKTEKKTDVQNINGDIISIPFLLHDYTSPVELIKNTSSFNTVQYSLKRQKNSEYLYGKIYSFTIKDVISFISNDGIEKKMFEVYDSSQKLFTVVVQYVDVYKYNKGDSVDCLIVNITPDKIFLKLANKQAFPFRRGKTYKFTLIDAREYSTSKPNLSYLIIKDENGEYYSTIGPSWQRDYKRKIDEIFCTPNDNGKLEQVYINVKHPLFKTNLIYEFVFKNEIKEYHNKVTVIGPDKCLYNINRPFTFFNKSIPEGTKFRLVYRKVDNRGDIKTKLFINFEDIISNFRAIKRITFDSFRKEALEADEDSLITKMIKDFDNFENLWIISFCEVLRKKINSALYEKDFESALIFMDVLLLVEQWILDSGFLHSFSIHKRETTSIVAIKEIELLSKEVKALELLLDNKDEDFTKKFVEELDVNQGGMILNIDKIFIQLYIYKYKNYDDEFIKGDFINVIQKLGIKEFFNKEKDAAEIVLFILDEIRNAYEKALFYGVFINSEKRTHYYLKNNQLLEYIKITYLTLLVQLDIENVKGTFYVLLRLLRLMSLYESRDEIQLKIISNAIKLSSSSVGKIVESANDFFTWEVQSDLLEKVINLFPVDNIKSLRNIIEIEESLQNNTYIRVRVTDNSWLGYEVMYKEDRLFLPFFNSHRSFTKGEQIEVIVYLIDKDFHHVLVKTFVNHSKIPIEQSIEVGNVVKGIVKRFEDYGVFVNLGIRDALLPRKEVSIQYVINAEDVLDIGDIIETKVIAKNKIDDILRITLSRKEKLIDTIKNLKLEAKLYEGRITNIDETYGIFIELSNGHSGLIRREEVSWNELESINEIYNRGERLLVKFIHTRGGKNYFSLKLNIQDPFYNNRLLNKIILAKIIKINDFDVWLNMYAIEDKNISNLKGNGYYTYCPFCYVNSVFRKNSLKLTEDRTIKITEDKRNWDCQNCGYKGYETILVYLKDIHCSSYFNISTLNKREYSKIRNSIESKDLIETTVIRINHRSRQFIIDLNIKSIKKGKLKTQFSSLEKYITLEIAGAYEQYAFLSSDFEKRINYLDWARYYYGVGKSAKSYFLNAYISYINLIRNSVQNDSLNEDIDSVIEQAKKLIHEIEIQNESFEAFPVIGKIIVLLKVLSNLKSNSEESYMFLLNVSLSEIGHEHEYIKNLAEAVLSYNLCEKGADSIVNESLKSRIALLLKRSLSSFSDNKLDTEDLKRRMLVEKIIARGEDNSIEFKASLDVPVLSKDIKLAILEQKEKLNLEIEVEKKEKIKSRIHELSNINTSDKRLISLVNLSIIKTIAAFANTSGGHLLIGVDENELGEPYVLGLNADLNKHKNKDGILLRLDEIVHKYIGNGMHSALIQSIDFVSYKGKEIILIAIKKSSIPIFVAIDSEKKFFIRRQASTTCLNSHELFEFMMHTGVISRMDNQL